jgi:hypothetical protein
VKHASHPDRVIGRCLAKGRELSISRYRGRQHGVRLCETSPKRGRYDFTRLNTRILRSQAQKNEMRASHPTRTLPPVTQFILLKPSTRFDTQSRLQPTPLKRSNPHTNNTVIQRRELSNARNEPSSRAKSSVRADHHPPQTRDEAHGHCGSSGDGSAHVRGWLSRGNIPYAGLVNAPRSGSGTFLVRKTARFLVMEE